LRTATASVGCGFALSAKWERCLPAWRVFFFDAAPFAGVVDGGGTAAFGGPALAPRASERPAAAIGIRTSVRLIPELLH
jgi:hypothetical protein